jgi:hypothetical protein
VLFCCAEPRCDGLSPRDHDVFVDGGLQACDEMMAVIAITDGADCDGTVATFVSVSAEFAMLCSN